MQNDFVNEQAEQLSHIGEMVELHTEQKEAAEAEAPAAKPYSAEELLAAAKKSQIAAYGAQKDGDKAYQMTQKVLQQFLSERENLPTTIDAEEFLHKELLAVRDAIFTLNSSLAAEKIGVQLSEESLNRATAEYDRMAKEADSALNELQRLQKATSAMEKGFAELLQKQQELMQRLHREEEKLHSAKAAAKAAESLYAKSEERKSEAAKLMQEAADFDKTTREEYRKLQLSFAQARENAAGLLTQLRSINAKLPDDLEELLINYEEQEAKMTKKKLFGKK